MSGRITYTLAFGALLAVPMTLTPSADAAQDRAVPDQDIQGSGVRRRAACERGHLADTRQLVLFGTATDRAAFPHLGTVELCQRDVSFGQVPND